MNILFLGGAKRVSMARLFVKAAEALGERCRIYSYEKSRRVPIACVGEVIVGLKWSDPDIYEDLYRIVVQKNINVIVPFVDGAVAVAATFAAKYPGLVFAPTSSPALSEAMFDKVVAAGMFADAGLPIPETYAEGMTDMPLIAKPRHGSASQGIVCIDDVAELACLPGGADQYIIQRRIDRREEYTVDCYVSVVTHRVLAAVPRLRIEVTGGEVSHTITVFLPEVVELAQQTVTRIGLTGAVTVQVIRDLDTGRLMVMEVNPRLGGGAVCTVMAGSDIPRLILTESMGREVSPVTYRPNTEMLRYPQEVMFYNE